MFYINRDIARRGGGANPKKDDPDRRSPFAKDRDRIIYTSAFLRLAGKTQVVSSGEPGLYHNRLTHTLKVAQLGRRAAERLRTLFIESQAGTSFDRGILFPPDPDLIEAACYAHDLGHPPFGHAGEEALKDALDAPFVKRQRSRAEIENSGFEGNAQTFRILTYLAVRRGRGKRRYGLDLTRATLDATIKYPFFRTSLEQRKWGAYGLDREAFTWVRKGAPEGKQCFEAQVMDWCDDVTYAVHDVIDCYRGHLIPLHALFHNSPSKGKTFRPTSEAAAFLSWLEESYKKGPHKLVHPELEALNPDERFERWGELENFFLKIETPFSPRTKLKSELDGLATHLFSYFMNGLTWSDGDVPCRYGARLVIDENDEVAHKKRIHCSLLQELPWYYVIRSRRLGTQQHGQQEIIRALTAFHAHDKADLELLLPEDRFEELDAHNDPRRAVADHVASLTERDASALHARLSGLQIGSITDAV